jgi:hypothetical protein
VHGWIYGLKDGLIHDLRINVTSPLQLPESADTARANLGRSFEGRA